jgi:hypothetical protein
VIEVVVGFALQMATGSVRFGKVGGDDAVEAVRRNSANVTEFQGRVQELITIEKREVRPFSLLSGRERLCVHI